MRSPGINGEGELRGQLANQFTWKMAAKMECACVCVCASHLSMSLELTQTDRLPTTSCWWSVVTKDLSQTTTRPKIAFFPSACI